MALLISQRHKAKTSRWIAVYLVPSPTIMSFIYVFLGPSDIDGPRNRHFKEEIKPNTMKRIHVHIHSTEPIMHMNNLSQDPDKKPHDSQEAPMRATKGRSGCTRNKGRPVRNAGRIMRNECVQGSLSDQTRSGSGPGCYQHLMRHTNSPPRIMRVTRRNDEACSREQAMWPCRRQVAWPSGTHKIQTRKRRQ